MKASYNIWIFILCFFNLLGCVEMPEVRDYTPQIVEVKDQDITYKGVTLVAEIKNYTSEGYFYVADNQMMEGAQEYKIYEFYKEGVGVIENLYEAEIGRLTSGQTYYYQLIIFDEFKSEVKSFTTVPREQQTIKWNVNYSAVSVGDTIDYSAYSTSGLDVTIDISIDVPNYEPTDFLDINKSKKLAICMVPCKLIFNATQAGNQDYLAAESIERTIEVVDFPDIEFEKIDLGLSVKWANLNIGAKKISDMGDRYSINLYTDKPESELGSDWHTPTGEQFEELIKNCTVSEVRKFAILYKNYISNDYGPDYYHYFTVPHYIIKLTASNGNSIWINNLMPMWDANQKCFDIVVRESFDWKYSISWDINRYIFDDSKLPIRAICD